MGAFGHGGTAHRPSEQRMMSISHLETKEAIGGKILAPKLFVEEIDIASATAGARFHCARGLSRALATLELQKDLINNPQTLMVYSVSGLARHFL